jgi:OPA family glycerol-3-phosphate transporter-like MFS transporter
MFVTLLFFLTLIFVKDTPQQAGFGELDTGDSTEDMSVKVKMSEVLKKVFASKIMWMIGLGSMMIGFVRRSVVDAWFPVYFKDVYGITGTDVPYQLAAWGIAVLGIIGGFVFGIMSDRVYKGRRAPVIFYCFIGMVLILFLFYLSDSLKLGPVIAALMLVMLSFFVNGAHGMIGGAASMDFGGRKAAATAAGLIDGFQYLAGAFVGQAVGYITSNLGWQVWKLWPIPFALIGAVVMLFLWNAMPKGKASH